MTLKSMPPTLLAYRRDEYSQNGEDGIISELLDRININSGWFCEFGAWDGKYLSNTFNLIKNDNGWKGVLIEGGPTKYRDLEKTISEYPNRLRGINQYVTSRGSSALDDILNKTEIPTDFELLSIDIDGPDYFVWKNVKRYTPKIVIIEINSDFGPDLHFSSEMRQNGRFEINPDASDNPANFSLERKGEQIRLFGTSFKSMVELGESKGYTPVSCTNNNLIFVLDELADIVNLRREEYSDPTNLFLDDWGHGIMPFYNKSLAENCRMIKTSLRKNGSVKTGVLGISKVIRDIRRGRNV